MKEVREVTSRGDFREDVLSAEEEEVALAPVVLLPPTVPEIPVSQIWAGASTVKKLSSDGPWPQCCENVKSQPWAAMIGTDTALDGSKV